MKLKLFYFYKTGYVAKDASPIEASTIDWRTCSMMDRVFIQELEIDVPDCVEPSREEITNGIISDLTRQKNEILAETHRKVKVLDDKIQELLCIEMKP